MVIGHKGKMTIGTKLQVMGPKQHANAHRPLIGSQHTKTGQWCIITLATAATTRFFSRFPTDFQVQGHISKLRSHKGKMICPCTTVPSWVIDIPNMGNLASKPWTQHAGEKLLMGRQMDRQTDRQTDGQSESSMQGN